jgi:hypothetical protein
MMNNVRIFLLMALLAMAGNASADELVISDFSISPGETKTISIALDNPTNDYIAFEFWMRLPDGVRIVYDDDDFLMATLNSSRADRHELEVKEPDNDGVYHFLCYSNRNNTFREKSGEIISLTVKCAEDAVDGSYEASLYNLIFSDPNKVQVDLPDVSFDITIVGVSPGDANGDGSISIADVAAVVNYIVTNGNPTVNFVQSAADVDGVEGITIADALAIVNIVLGK